MSVIQCPKCGKETNTIFIDGLGAKSKGCYLRPENREGVWIWVRGCVSRADLNSYFVWSAKQYLNKAIMVNGKPYVGK